MINQRSFYTSIASMDAPTRMLAKFRQVGDIAEAGFLPKNSAGSCSFTTLDFQRALSQGTESEWMRAAEKAKNSSSIWQTTLGQKGNSFGARQQLNYFSPDHIAKDRLFTRSLSEERQQLVSDQKNMTYRDLQVSMEIFSSDMLTKDISSLLTADPEAYLRLNLILRADQGKGSYYGHTIAICPAKEKDQLYIMDPNIGVVLTNKKNLVKILELLKTKLYKDFLMTDTSIEIQGKFWLDPAKPLTQEQIERFKKEEVSLLNQFSLSDYEAYKKNEAKMQEDVAKRLNVDIDMDMEFEDDIKELEDTDMKQNQEAVFDEEGWENLPTIETNPDASLISTSIFKDAYSEIKKSSNPETPIDEIDEWELINKNDYKPK